MAGRRLAPALTTLSMLTVALLCIAAPSSAHAAGDNKGLLITPIRQFLSVDAGNSVSSSITIANLTGAPMDVALSVEQFSVANYTYDYTFDPPTDNWLKLSTTSTTLQPNQSRSIPYSVTVPGKSTPGGRYYTLIASARVSSRGVGSVIQAADLLYLTINGKLTSVSHLQSSSIDWFSFGHDINFDLQPINTGNIYTFVYVSGQLHGPFTKPAQVSTAHVLMPGKVRALSSSIAAPVLPGIYKATYGYKTETNWIVEQEHWVIFIPPWFVAFVLAVLLLAGKFLPKLRRRGTKSGTSNTGVDQYRAQ